MMEGKSNLIVSRKLYVEETLERMAAMIRSLSAMQDDCQGQMDPLLRQLREQAEASHRVNYESIVRLCQSMEDCLAKINSHIGKPQSEAAISALIDSCQLISEHAHAIAGLADRCENVEASR